MALLFHLIRASEKKVTISAEKILSQVWGIKLILPSLEWF